MPRQYDQFIDQFPQTEREKPLAPFTTLQVGGPADLYYTLTDVEELPELIQAAKKLEIPFLCWEGVKHHLSRKGLQGAYYSHESKKHRDSW